MNILKFTIALGALLAKQYSDAEYQLRLNDTDISIVSSSNSDQYYAILRSPNSRYQVSENEEVEETLALFN